MSFSGLFGDFRALLNSSIWRCLCSDFFDGIKGGCLVHLCRMDLPGPTTLVGTRTDYSVGTWDYPDCAARRLIA
jgi:hypothetical protein